MSYFDRFDICEAYLVFEQDYHVGGILQERESNQRRNMSTHYQLSRMGFKARPTLWSYKSLTENGREIYDNLRERYGLPEYPEVED